MSDPRVSLGRKARRDRTEEHPPRTPECSRCSTAEQISVTFHRPPGNRSADTELGSLFDALDLRRRGQ